VRVCARDALQGLESYLIVLVGSLTVNITTCLGVFKRKAVKIASRYEFLAYNGVFALFAVYSGIILVGHSAGAHLAFMSLITAKNNELVKGL
jgi:hypothetical protein